MSGESPNNGAATPREGWVIAFANPKGGVAKTTSCANVGAALALRGLRVLCLDLDPQARLTAAFEVSRQAAEASRADLLLTSPDLSLAPALLPTAVPKLELLPACPLLAQTEAALAAEGDPTGRLREKLRQLFAAPDPPDVVLLDCPPSLGLLTCNALVAATHLIAPATPRLYSFKSLAQLGGVVAALHREAGATVKLLGLLVTMFHENTSLDVTLYRLLRDKVEYEFGDFVFAKPIAADGAIVEAEASGRPVVVNAPDSAAAAAYLALTDEVLSRAHRDRMGMLAGFATNTAGEAHA